MDIDTNDIKIILQTCLQFLMKSCCGCLKDHPLISISGLFSLLLYIFLPSLFYIFLFTLSLVISSSIFLRGGVTSNDQNNGNVSEPVTEDNTPRLTKNHKFPSIKQGSIKLSRPSIQACMSRRTFKKRCEEATETDDDLVIATLERDFEMMAKIQGNENDNRDSCSTDMLYEDGDDDVYIGEEVKEESSTSNRDTFNQNSQEDVPDADIKSKEDRELEVLQGQQKTNFIVEWMEEDQKNMMELGSSEAERNQRLESLIAKRKARKILSIYPRRYYLKFGYNNVDQSHLSSIMVGRVNTDIDDEDRYDQPGSAPSVFLPATNPFDLPYDPSEERPNLCDDDDGFDEDSLFHQAKDMQYCRHESFNYGAWLMGDFNDETFEKPLTGYLSKPKALEMSGLSEVKKEPVKIDRIGYDSQDQLIPSPLQVKDWKTIDELSEKDDPDSDKETTLSSEPTNEGALRFQEIINNRQALEKKNEDYDDKQPMLTESKSDDISSTSPAKLTLSEDVFTVVENEALENTNLKVSTSSDHLNKEVSLGERYADTTYSPNLSSGNLGDSITDSANTEMGTPIDKGDSSRSTLVYDDGVNKDINLGGDELSVASSRQVQLEEAENENESNNARGFSLSLQGVAQRFPQDGENSGPEHSAQSSTFQTMDRDPTTEEGVFDEDANSSPRSVLHETNSFEDITSLANEDNTVTDHPLSVTTVTRSNSSNDVQHSSRDVGNTNRLESLHDSSFPATSSELAAGQVDVIDSVSSPKSVLRTIGSMDEIPSTSDQNIVTNSHQYYEAMVSNGSSNNLPHEDEQQQQQSPHEDLSESDKLHENKQQQSSHEDLSESDQNTITRSHQYDEPLVSNDSSNNLSHVGKQQRQPQPPQDEDSSEVVQSSYDSVSYRLQPTVTSESIKSSSEETCHSNVDNDLFSGNPGSGEEKKQEEQRSPHINQSESVEAIQDHPPISMEQASNETNCIVSA